MKLYRISLLMLAVVLAVGALGCAQAETVISGSYALDGVAYPQLNEETGLLYARSRQTGLYALYTADGQALTTEPYIHMNDLSVATADCTCAMFEVAVESGLNVLGLIDETGKLVVPMQYADVKVLSDRWQLGVKLAEATAENYDYKSSDQFYLVEAYDVYYCGALAGSLGRLDYYDGTPRGAYLYVRNVEGNYTYYDSAMNPSAYEGKYPSSSEYELISGDLYHRGSGQQAFVSGCTLTVDDVDMDYYVVGDNVVDVQGNVMGAVDPDYSDNVREFVGDYACYSEDDKYGLIDKNGREVLHYEYERINGYDGYFLGGYQILNQDGKIGYANADGEVTCEFKYAESIVDSVYNMPLTTLSDLEGNKIVLSGAAGELPGRYADVRVVNGCPLFAAEDSDGNAGLVDMYGKVLLPFDGSYDSLYDFTISRDGKVVLACNQNNEYTVYTFDDTGAAAPVAAETEAAAAVTEEAVQVPAEGWTCACGAVNAGNFCSECGATRPVEEEAEEIAEGWTCACGAVNSGNFCPDCGAARPEEKLVCKGCGYVPEEGTTPKFCVECGTAF